jgi:hypothetical protein
MVEDVLTRVGVPERLILSPRSRLRSRADSAHWHVRSSSGSGTIEVTFAPVAAEIVIAVHENRLGTWAAVAFEQFCAALAGELVSMHESGSRATPGDTPSDERDAG